MKINRKQVEKIVITIPDNFDDITVIFEDLDSTTGKTIIQTTEYCWAYQWHALTGEGMETFFRCFPFDYLINKLSPYGGNPEDPTNEFLKKVVTHIRLALYEENEEKGKS